MRERITRTTVYDFGELSESAQQEALEQIGTGIMEMYDPDQLTERFKEILGQWGFPIDDIEWSLNHGQGDGVAFYGHVDLKTYAEKANVSRRFHKLLELDTVAKIERNSFARHYSHWNTMSAWVECYDELGPTLYKHLDELQERLRDDVVKVSRDLESLGYAEFDHVTSRESIVELIKANEWEFTEHGRIV